MGISTGVRAECSGQCPAQSKCSVDTASFCLAVRFRTEHEGSWGEPPAPPAAGLSSC